MKLRLLIAGSLFCLIAVILLGGCSRDPNTRRQKYMESGRRYFDKAAYSAAIIQFGNAVQIDPQFAEGHLLLARSYLKLHEWAKAYEQLDRALEIQPENPQARLDMADLLILGGDFKRAQKELDLLASQRAGDPQFHVVTANLLSAQHNDLEAIQELQRSISLGAGWEAYLNLALLQLQSNQNDAAEASLRKALELNPRASAVRMALGNYYQSRHDFGSAEQQFHEAIRQEPEQIESRTALARLLMLEGKRDQAEELLRQSKRDLPANATAYRLLGDFYYAAGDYGKATEEYGSLFRDHPDDMLVKKNYIQLLILQNRLQDAQALNDQILKNRPDDIEALIDRGQLQMRNGDPAHAVQTLQAAIRVDGESALAYYHLGLAFQELADSRQAQTAWVEALRHNRDLVEADRALAAAALQSGSLDGLEQYSSEIIRLQPASADGYAFRAYSYIQRGQFARALADAEMSIEVAPHNAAGYVQMGNLKLAEKEYRDAEKSYRQALQCEPSSAEALFGLLNVLLAQGQREQAVAAVRGQISGVPNNSAFHDLLGTVLLQTGGQNGEEAESAFRKSTELDKHNTDAWLKLIQTQASHGLQQEAIATCERANQENRDVRLFILSGQLYESERAWQKAKDAYEHALELAPANPLASNNLAYVMLQTGGDPDVALSLAQAARRGMPDSPQAADTLGWVFYQKGSFKPAIHLFRESLELAGKGHAPDNPTVHWHLGLAYRKNGQLAQAREQLQQVLKIDPAYESADQVRKLLAQSQP